jgi:hypothetical protein
MANIGRAALSSVGATCCGNETMRRDLLGLLRAAA